jgi:hypothetical protein
MPRGRPSCKEPRAYLELHGQAEMHPELLKLNEIQFQLRFDMLYCSERFALLISCVGRSDEFFKSPIFHWKRRLACFEVPTRGWKPFDQFVAAWFCVRICHMEPMNLENGGR